MTIQRSLIQEIIPFLKRKEYIAVVGPRQAGKTTFLGLIKEYLVREEHLEENLIRMVTFEDRKLLRAFEDDPAAFARSFVPENTDKTVYLMMDEFQYVSEGGQKLKLIYDTIKNLKVIITGSSSLEIKAQVGRYMVGRVLTFHLYPFSFEELLQARDARLAQIYRKGRQIIASWLFEDRNKRPASGRDTFFHEMFPHYTCHCLWGGYPAVVLSGNDTERYKVLGDIFNNYILKDIKGLRELATEKNLFLLSQFIATQIGSIVVYQNMGNAAQLDFRRLKQHLHILKETFICDEAAPFFKNRQKELTKNPKFYFMDMGFRNFLIENMNGFDKRPDSGAVVENAVFIGLKEMWNKAQKINFWRTKAGAEVDFVLHIKDGRIPVEVKWASFKECSITRSLASFIDSFKPVRGIVLTKDYWGVAKHGGTEILCAPVYYL